MKRYNLPEDGVYDDVCAVAQHNAITIPLRLNDAGRSIDALIDLSQGEALHLATALLRAIAQLNDHHRKD